MIESLRVQDFVLVDDLDLAFGPGFTVLTGETGAGKSVLLRALGLLLGDRASREAVRAGADRTRVEAVFDPTGPVRSRVAALLEVAGVPWDDDEPLVVARQVSADGRSRAHVNGALVPRSVLAALGALLVEVSSQHQHQGLLREESHPALLDAALDGPGRAALAAADSARQAWQAARLEVERLERLEREGADRAASLRFQADEIRAARLEPGEGEQLVAERDLLSHAGKLLEAYAGAESELYSGPDAAVDRVARARRAVTAAAGRDPGVEPVLDLLAEAGAALEEASARLRDRQAVLQADPGRLDAVEDRLAEIRRLERRYGGNVDAVLARLAAIEADLAEVDGVEVSLADARRRLETARAEWDAAARILRAARQTAADRLEAAVNRELDALALGRSAFRVALGARGGEGPDDGGGARFLLAANPGEPPRPLARIASGGELSRVLLAVKNALRDRAVDTLVFDEVDAGVGGAVADAVGERLERLARTCQVVCITHLPQIASRAHRHLRVEKVAAGDRTVIRVVPLIGDDRVEELARMLGGRRVTETTRHHARELVEGRTP